MTQFTVICTHWDDQSDAQRRVAASLILRRAAHEQAATRAPVFVLGDFNSPTSGPAYAIMTGSLGPVPINSTFAQRYPAGGGEGSGGSKFKFLDAAAETPPLGRSGHHFTFTGFLNHADMTLLRIDFIMGGNGHAWASEMYHVGETFWDRGSMNSDHRPVYADLTWS